MNEQRKMQVLVILTLILATTWLLGTFIVPPVAEAGKKSEALVPLTSLTSLTSLTIEGLMLDGRDSEQWMFSEERVPARNDRVQQLVDALKDSGRIRRVAAEQKDLENFGLASPQTMELVGDTTHTLYFGNVAAGTKEIFVTLESEAPIFTTSSELSFYFRQTPIYWKDVRLFPESERPELDSLERIGITSAEGSFILRKFFDTESNALQWVFDGSEDMVDTEKADGFVRTFFRFEAKDILVTSIEGEGIGEISLSDGRQNFRIAVYPAPDSEEGEPQFYLQPSGLRAGYVFVVSESIQNRILRRRAHFLSASAETSGP